MLLWQIFTFVNGQKSIKHLVTLVDHHIKFDPLSEGELSPVLSLTCTSFKYELVASSYPEVFHQSVALGLSFRVFHLTSLDRRSSTRTTTNKNHL